VLFSMQNQMQRLTFQNLFHEHFFTLEVVVNTMLSSDNALLICGFDLHAPDACTLLLAALASVLNGFVLVRVRDVLGEQFSKIHECLTASRSSFEFNLDSRSIIMLNWALAFCMVTGKWEAVKTEGTITRNCV